MTGLGILKGFLTQQTVEEVNREIDNFANEQINESMKLKERPHVF